MENLNTSLQDLKEKLNKELQKEHSNNDLIIELSHKIAQMDNDKVRFSVDAGVINRLGKELVGRHETAVAELVKNAYDADATEVEINFDDCEEPGGIITILDNGVGMSKDDLIKGFMTISSSDKIHNPKSPRFERTRAGQKGIGRFATQRLGEKLTIITQQKSKDEALVIEIDWQRFSMDTNLLTISNEVKKRPKIKEEGTDLVISNVRDRWTEHQIKRSYKYITDLLQPFPLSSKFEESKNDPGFKVTFYKDQIAIIDETTTFFQHALAEIEAYVDENGHGYYSFNSTKLKIQEEVYLIGKDDRETPYSDLKNIHLKAYYFIWNVGLIPKNIEKSLRDNARQNGGIRLYRNGFRVLPYGENDDDWLGLDASVRRRSFIAPHSNMHFFGFVEIIDKEGEIFQEQSSREGLLSNNALSELKDFGYKVLTDVAIKISSIRDRKGTAGQKNWERKKSKEILNEVKGEVDQIISKEKKVFDQVKIDEKGNIDVALKTVKDKLVEFESTFEEENEENEKKTQELLREIQLLRILAGLGLTIGEFVHEINHYEPAFQYDANHIISKLEEKEDIEVGQRLLKNLQSFTVYTSFFKEAISENVNRELKPIEIREPVKNFLNTINPDVIRSGIIMDDPIFNGYNLYTCPMHYSEWASILFNLYTNSKKAIKRKGVNGHIKIEAGKAQDKVYLEFSDNGVGIPENKEEEIFNAFYTTSAPSGQGASEIEELTGTGLGLKILKDIIEGYGGEIFVTSPKPNFSTTLRIELPKTNIEDYDEL